MSHSSGKMSPYSVCVAIPGIRPKLDPNKVFDQFFGMEETPAKQWDPPSRWLPFGSLENNPKTLPSNKMNSRETLEVIRTQHLKQLKQRNPLIGSRTGLQPQKGSAEEPLEFIWTTFRIFPEPGISARKQLSPQAKRVAKSDGEQWGTWVRLEPLGIPFQSCSLGLW